MTKSEIRNLHDHEIALLANQRNESGNYTSDALKAQEIIWEDSWASVYVNNNPDPFDFLPSDVED